MDKLKMHSPNLVDANIEKISVLFPNCITEAQGENGELKKAIDFDLLKQELSQVLVEGEQERYRLDWVGKKEAILTANAPIAKTLRPCREESVNFDSTENLFIEGDNLEALKLLQENYLGKVKMIYIDPPYNTGNDFIYEDDFAESTFEFLERSNQLDEEGNRLIANTESNGRFHSDWLSMMYSRLKLARNLLSDDGIVFFQIGQEEVSNAEKMLSEVFGDSNKLAIISRVAKTASDAGKFFAPSTDYLICYAKNESLSRSFNDEVKVDLFKKVENDGPRKGELYRDDVALYQSSLTLERSRNARYFIECPDGTKCIPPEGKRWRVVEETFLGMKDRNDIVFKETKSSPLFDEIGNRSKWNLYTKSYLTDRQEKGAAPRNYIDQFINRQGADLIKKIGIPFDFSKPVGLIKYLIKIINQDKDITILDFFAGSSTTAHAVMQLNAEDQGHRKFIMVQLPEPTDEKSEAFKAGYKNIAEISKERIRRAGNRILEDNANKEGIENLDIGFRVLKIDSTNMKDVYYTPDAIKQADMLDLADNIKSDRTSEDLLFQVMLDWGLELSLPIERKTIAGKEVFYVAGNSLVACFEELTFDVVDEVAKDHPLRFVSAEKAIHLDHDKTNIKERFKQLSPDTEVKFL
ncbi:site-specific DNA-methyltransferase [Acinetobacter guillouiae]|uniref:site-specific DNA-methyltransferase n=1 Tax=Acinetobacter guillouiae TaxID=106649 RepID=UPI003AF54152